MTTKKKNKWGNITGFTLVELIVVSAAMAILFLLAGWLLFQVSYWWNRYDTPDFRWQSILARQALKEQLSASKLYRLEHHQISLISAGDTIVYHQSDSGLVLLRTPSGAKWHFPEDSAYFDLDEKSLICCWYFGEQDSSVFNRPLFWNEPLVP